MPRRPQRTLGKPASAAHAAALLRALRPMLAQVRATLPSVATEADARALGAALRREWPDRRLAAEVERAGKAAERAASAAWAPIDRALGRRRGKGDARPYDATKLLDRWSRDATGKIRSVRDEIVPALRRDILDAARKGTSASDLAARWLRGGVPVSFGTAEGRLTTIARHQLQVLHAKVQSERARAVGVVEFVWRTQGDDRVRDEHERLEGTRHRYDDPPSEGLPGEPVNCRCWAESVIPDELAIELGFAIE